MIMNALRSTALAAAFGLIALPVLADDITFVLNNATSVDLYELYASPTSVGDWEEDILGADILEAGDSATITIGDERGCDYDIKAVFADGDEITDQLNICDTASYTLSEG